MSVQVPLTFAVPVNDRKVFAANFLASPLFREGVGYQVLVQEGFASASRAYNDAINQSTHDLIVFAHQDVIFPSDWLTQLMKAIRYLEDANLQWGVLGCWGAIKDGGYAGHMYSTGLGVLGQGFEQPAEVQTLDEAVLVIRKSSGLQFDSSLPHFHLYGTDLCMAAASRNLTSYAISAFCIHNTQQITVLPQEFYACYRHVKQAWTRYLPIETTCITITRFNLPIFERKVRELYAKYSGRLKDGMPRFDSFTALLGQDREISFQCESFAPRHSGNL